MAFALALSVPCYIPFSPIWAMSCLVPSRNTPRKQLSSLLYVTKTNLTSFAVPDIPAGRAALPFLKVLFVDSINYPKDIFTKRFSDYVRYGEFARWQTPPDRPWLTLFLLLFHNSRKSYKERMLKIFLRLTTWNEVRRLLIWISHCKDTY